MKNYLILFVFLFVCSLSQGQVTSPSDSIAASLDSQMEKLVTDPVFYLKTESDSCILLAKSQIKGIDARWVHAIDVSTENDVRKKFGYSGRETLIFITLKKRYEKKFLESNGSSL